MWEQGCQGTWNRKVQGTYAWEKLHGHLCEHEEIAPTNTHTLFFSPLVP